jgi:hypothetical protein
VGAAGARAAPPPEEEEEEEEHTESFYGENGRPRSTEGGIMTNANNVAAKISFNFILLQL